MLLITRGLVLLSDWEELEEARGRRLKTIKNTQTNVELINQLIQDLLLCRFTNSTSCLLYYEYFVFSVFHLKRAKIQKSNKNKEE